MGTGFELQHDAGVIRMTTLTSTDLVISSQPDWPIHRFSVAQYRRWTESGFLTADENIELLDGWLVDKPATNPPHDSW